MRFPGLRWLRAGTARVVRLPLLLPLSTGVVLVAGWWAATEAFGIPSLFLPGPGDIAAAFAGSAGTLADAAGVTIFSVLAGFGLAVVTAVPLAGFLGAARLVERALMPWIVAVNAVPKVAIMPLLLLWLGFGQPPRIVLVWLMCAFPILINTMVGLRSLPAEHGELARSMCVSPARMFVKFRLPWALPQVFAALQIAVGLAVVGSVVAEVAAPDEGLGALIVMASANADTPLAFGACAALAGITLALFYLVVAAERILLPWAAGTRA